MSGARNIGVALCYTCVAISVISLMIPQKRTRRVMSFVIGLFFVSTFMTSVSAQLEDIDLSVPQVQEQAVPSYSEDAYDSAAAQLTADGLTRSLNELLENEGIQADDIQLTLKISDEGRIYVLRAVIYISEAFKGRISDVESIVYRNIAKEPEIYVTGEETQRVAER